MIFEARHIPLSDYSDKERQEIVDRHVTNPQPPTLELTVNGNSIVFPPEALLLSNHLSSVYEAVQAATLYASSISARRDEIPRTVLVNPSEDEAERIVKRATKLRTREVVLFQHAPDQIPAQATYTPSRFYRNGMTDQLEKLTQKMATGGTIVLIRDVPVGERPASNHFFLTS